MLKHSRDHARLYAIQCLPYRAWTIVYNIFFSFINICWVSICLFERIIIFYSFYVVIAVCLSIRIKPELYATARADLDLERADNACNLECLALLTKAIRAANKKSYYLKWHSLSISYAVNKYLKRETKLLFKNSFLSGQCPVDI